MKLLFVILLSATCCYGQALTGNLTGAVTDPSGLAIAGARITATHKATGQQFTGETQASGEYLLRALPPGVYSVAAEKDGFKRALSENAEVLSEQTLRVDFQMEIGAVAEQVLVTAAAPRLLTETTKLETVVDRDRIADLPTNGRNFMDVLLLFPGVNEGIEVNFAASDNLSPTGEDSTVTVSGGRLQSNVFLLNGTINTDGRQNLMALHPSLDTVEQVSVNRSTNSAEFGRSGAGQINVVTRGGGARLRGSIFEYFRNDALDARGFFNNLNDSPKEIRRQNQFGGTLGGPVKIPRLYNGRDRTFFFAAFEGSRIRIGTSGYAQVPTAQQRQGDFSAERFPLYDPLTTNTVTGERQPFPGNRIPAGRFSTVAQKTLEMLYPLPNIPRPRAENNYYNAGSTITSNNQVNGRIDHRFSDRDTLSGIYFFNDRPQQTARSVMPGRLNTHNARTQNLTLSYYRILSPRAFNEVKLGFSRARYGEISGAAYKEDIIGALGIEGSDRTPVNWGVPTINITGGYTAISDPNPTWRRNNTFQFVDNFSLTRGSHNLRVGAEIRRSQINNREDRNARGTLTFSGVYTARLTVTSSAVTAATSTGDGFADLLLGFPSRSSRAVGEPLNNYLRNTSWNYYINDDWKVTPRLMINVGLRYELTPPYADKFDHMANTLIGPSFTTFVKVFPGQPNPFDGTTLPRALVVTDYNNLAPRFGIAYRARPKMVVRAAYGIFFNTPPADITLFNLTNQVPLYMLQSVNYDTAVQPRRDILVPKLTFGNPFTGPLNGQTSFGVEYGMRTPYTQQWNFNIQQEAMNGLTLEAAYVGSLSLKLEQQVAMDRPTQVKQPDGRIVLMPPVSPELWENVSAPGGSLMSMGGGASNYHALQLSANQKYRGGLSFLAAYTWSKSIDNSSERGGHRSSAGTAQNSLDLRNERGLSGFDIRHRFSMSYSYDLPFGPGRKYLARISGPAGALLGGWRISGVNSLSTTTPRTARSNTALNWTGVYSAAERANATGIDQHLPREQRTIEHYFNTAAFTAPQPIPGSNPLIYYFGTAGRNTIVGPGRVNFDISALKNVRLSERRELQFRGEFFNVLNITNYRLGSQSVLDSAGRPNPQFGRVTETWPHRKVQLSLRLSF